MVTPVTEPKQKVLFIQDLGDMSSGFVWEFIQKKLQGIDEPFELDMLKVGTPPRIEAEEDIVRYLMHREYDLVLSPRADFVDSIRAQHIGQIIGYDAGFVLHPERFDGAIAFLDARDPAKHLVDSIKYFLGTIEHPSGPSKDEGPR